MKRLFKVLVLCLFLIPMHVFAEGVEVVFEDQFAVNVKGKVFNTNDNTNYYFRSDDNDNSYNGFNYKPDTLDEYSKMISSTKNQLTKWAKNKLVENPNVTELETITDYLDRVELSEDAIVTSEGDYQNDLVAARNLTLSQGNATVYVKTEHVMNLEVNETSNFNIIDSIELNIDDNLIIGSLPTFNGTVLSKNVTLDNEYWVNNYYDDYSSNVEYNSSNEFTIEWIVNRETYNYAFDATFDKGYILSDNAAIIVNGKSNKDFLVNISINNGTMSICAYEVYSVTPTDSTYDISEIRIENAKTTLTEGNITYNATSNSNAYKVDFESIYYQDEEQLYLSRSDIPEGFEKYIYLKDLKEIVADITYQYAIAIKALNGYSFTDDVKLYLDGIEETLKEDNLIYNDFIYLNKDIVAVKVSEETTEDTGVGEVTETSQVSTTEKTNKKHKDTSKSSNKKHDNTESKKDKSNSSKNKTALLVKEKKEKKSDKDETTTTKENEDNTKNEATTKIDSTSKEEKKSNYTWIYVTVGVILLVGILFFILFRRKK
ncbi:MAG: hypothetical protein IJ574_04300 [Bacilli bacterium]|nr:hypothetical protein [Bacilli bacterium]